MAKDPIETESGGTGHGPMFIVPAGGKAEIEAEKPLPKGAPKPSVKGDPALPTSSGGKDHGPEFEVPPR